MESNTRYRRQFLLSAAELPTPESWRTLEVGNGFHLHHCPELPVRRFTDMVGSTWFLLGHAYSVVTDNSALIASEISTSTIDTIPALVRHWSGRWLLINQDAVITDAAGLLGTFILENDKEVLLSNSLALLNALRKTPVTDSRIISWHGFNWYPLPASKYQAIRKLLPDQIYSLSSRRTVFYDRLELPPASNTSVIAANIVRGLCNVVRQIHNSQNGCRLLLALTAGLDSRTSYAVLRSSGIPFSTMTMRNPRISIADRTIPELIAKRHHIHHKFIVGHEYSAARCQQYDQHTDATVFDGDRYFYSYGTFEGLGVDYLIRSGCWEIGRKYFHRQLSGLDLQEIYEQPEKLLQRFRTYCNTRASSQGVKLWAAWRLQHKLAIDWRDLFYRDQRLAGWLSSIEQSLDLIAPVSIHPVNSDYFYGLLIRSSQQETVPNIQKAIINLCVPELGDIPINPSLDGVLYRTHKLASKTKAFLAGELQNLIRKAVAS